MTSAEVNHQLILVRRPRGEVQDSDLERRERPLRELSPGEIRVRNLLLSIDPTNRVWMSEIPQYMPPVALGELMRGIGIGLVVASDDPKNYPVGAHVRGYLGWQQYTQGRPAKLGLASFRPDPEIPLSAYLGALGSSGGVTAYLGLELGDIAPGETLLVSAAAGSVGSIAGQIAKKFRGARVIGVAGGPEKCSYVVDELGFDACLDYRAGDIGAGLRSLCPGGLDVDFENVGGPVLDAVLANLALRARIILCGLVAEYNADAPPPGPRNFEQLLMRRARIQGFLILDHLHRVDEATAALSAWYKAGQLRTRETVLEGLGAAPEALRRLLRGDKIGKMLVKLADA